jgi:hypothetical protein
VPVGRVDRPNRVHPREVPRAAWYPNAVERVAIDEEIRPGSVPIGGVVHRVIGMTVIMHAPYYARSQFSTGTKLVAYPSTRSSSTR